MYAVNIQQQVQYITHATHTSSTLYVILSTCSTGILIMRRITNLRTCSLLI